MIILINCFKIEIIHRGFTIKIKQEWKITVLFKTTINLKNLSNPYMNENIFLYYKPKQTIKKNIHQKR